MLNIRLFNIFYINILASQQKVQSIRDNLQSCKNLLQCKRDELRKLWLEGLEHKIVVNMLDQMYVIDKKLCILLFIKLKDIFCNIWSLE